MKAIKDMIFDIPRGIASNSVHWATMAFDCVYDDVEEKVRRALLDVYSPLNDMYEKVREKRYE